MADLKYFLTNTNADGGLPAGDDFTKELSTTDPGSSTNLLVVTASLTTEYSYAYTPTGEPGSDDWPDNETWTIVWYLSAFQADLTIDAELLRCNSSGTPQETKTSDGGAQSVTATGAYTFTFTNPTWSTGATGDLIRIHAKTYNSNTHVSRNIDIDTQTSYVITPFGAAFTWLQMEQDDFIQPPEPVAVPYQ